MDEFERQRRKDFIRQVKSNNKIGMMESRMELIEDTRKMPRPDRIGAWRADAEEQERQRVEERERMLREEQEATLDQRIQAAIIGERALIWETVGIAIGEMLDLERDHAKGELGSEVKKLWSVLRELRQEIAALKRTVDKAAAIDLPNPLTRA